jgi:hypothetical protein
LARAAQPRAAAVHWFGLVFRRAGLGLPLGRLPPGSASDSSAVAPPAETRGLPAASRLLPRPDSMRMWPPPPRAARPSYSSLESGVAVWIQSPGRGGRRTLLAAPAPPGLHRGKVAKAAAAAACAVTGVRGSGPTTPGRRRDGVRRERGDRVGRTQEQEGPGGEPRVDRPSIHPSWSVGLSVNSSIIITSTPGWIRITLSSPTVVATRMHVHYSTSIHHPGFFISSAFSNVLRNTGYGVHLCLTSSIITAIYVLRTPYS